MVPVQSVHKAANLWPFEPWAVDPSLLACRSSRELRPLTPGLDRRAVSALLVGWCRSNSKGEQSQREAVPV